MKKISLLLALALLLGLTACGREEPEPVEPPVEEGPLYLETLAVELSRGGLGARELSAAVKELPEALRDCLADTGTVEIGEVRVTVGSSASATAQALAEGNIDLAFLPAEAFLRGGGAMALLAGAQQPQPDSDFVEAGATAMLRAGATTYGGQLAARSGGAPLTWEEMENARWGVSETEAAGDCFDLWLAANFDGARTADLPQVTLYTDDEALLDAALTGEIDALAICREGWTRTADAGAEETLPLLAETEALCTQLAAVSPARAELADARFAAALEQALRRLGEERPDLMEALGTARFTAVEDGDLDSARRLLALDEER